MNVPKGELRAIIGPNGAGKTTFFNLISGFFAPDLRARSSSTAAIITLVSTHPRGVKLGIARTFQVTEIFPELTVFENVRISTEVAAGATTARRGSAAPSGRDREPAIADALALVGLAAKADRLVGELSHGDQRASEIAMALALRPHLLLLDEPTAGMGDQETSRHRQADPPPASRRTHFTIVLIEHDMRVVFHLADRISVLDQGRLLAEGTPKEIAANDSVPRPPILGQAPR